jgi:putative membrane protein
MLFKKLLLLGTVSASLVFTACSDDDEAVIDNVNQADRTFVSNATMINNSQIALGELAQTRSVNDSVIMYGEMLAEEHAIADAELDSLATTLNISFPDSLDATMIALRDRLAGLNGYDFDTAFINAQLAGHNTAIAQFETQVNTGSNANIRAYANKYLTAIRAHRAMADSVSSTLE